METAHDPVGSSGLTGAGERAGEADPFGGVPSVRRRTHHVTAILVTCQGRAWLPRTFSSLVRQDRAPDALVAVDAGSTDGSAEFLAPHVPVLQAVEPGRQHPQDMHAAALDLATAQARSDRQASPAPNSDQPAPVDWYWIVHDDSAPEPDCLDLLLEGADRNPRAAVLIPKTVGWSDPERLVGVGSLWAPGNPVVDRLEHSERDQGQYDVDREVYTGSSAGMLVRADVWHAQGGFDQRVGAWAAPTALCRRVWGSGHTVMLIPQAALAHRLAGHHGARDPQVGGSPRRRSREAQLLLELSRGSAWSLPLRYLRAWVATLLRALALLVTHDPGEVRAKLAGSWDVLGHPGRIRAARRTLKAAGLPESIRPDQVRAYRGAVVHGAIDDWMAGARAGNSRIWGWRPTRHTWRVAGVAGVLALLSLIRAPGVLFGAGTLRGGGLLPAPDTGALISGYLSSWHDVGLGTGSALPPYLAVLAAAGVPFLGTVDLLLRLLFGLAVPLAFLSAYASLGSTRFGPWRWVIAVTWALLPAGVAAGGDGRISTLAVLLLGPLALRSLVNVLAEARAGAPAQRPVLVAGVLLGLTGCFAPTMLLLVAIGCTVAWLVAGRPRWALRRGSATFGIAALFLLPWLPRLVRAPWLLLTDLGRTDPGLTRPAAAMLGLSPGGPGVLWWAGVPLAVATVVAAVAYRASWRPALVVAVACLALAGLAWLPQLAERVWSAQVAERVWLGQPLLLVTGALLLVLGWLSNRAGRGAERSGMALLTALVVLGVGWWLAPVQLATSSASGQPAVVSLAQGTEDRPRAVVLSRSADAVRFGVSTTPEAYLGDADALADVLDGQGLTDTIRALVSGSGVDVSTALGARAIRYVVFNGAPDDPLVAELDATTGMRRLASSDQQSLWLVSGDPVRASLDPQPQTPAAPGALAPGRVVVPVATVPTTVDVVLHPQIELPRTMRLAEMAEPGWTVRVDGKDVAVTPDDYGLVSGQVASSGSLTASHSSLWPWLAGAHLLLMVALVVLALPRWRSAATEEPAG